MDIEVREVFNDARCETLDSTKTCIAKTITRIQRFQESVRKHIDGNYVDFMPNHSSADVYLEEGEALLREADDVLRKVGGDTNSMLQTTDAELKSCLTELTEITLGLRVNQLLLQIDDLFQCVDEANAKKEYLMVLDLMNKLKSLIYCESGITAAEIGRVVQKLNCYDALKVKYQIEAHMLQQNLQQRFEQLLQLNCKSFPTSKCVTLAISKDEVQLQDTVMALFQARYNPQKVCDFLLENCLEPVILKPVSVDYTTSKDAEYSLLTLSYSLKDLDAQSCLRPSYNQVFEHVKTIFNCLSSINVSVTASQHVFSIIGDYIKSRFLTLLVDECLMHAIPETMEEYQTSTLVEDVHQFEQLLADTFLINLDTDHILSEFIKNFEIYYRNQLYKRLLESAKEIMAKDLQDMMPIAERDETKDLTNNSFLLACCMISKSTMEYIKLMERVLRQPVEKKGDGASDPLLNVIPIMLNAYIVEVPKIHKTLLESIPQQSVLFYNNCMFLAQWLIHNSDKNIATFPALVSLLQATGLKYYNLQVDYQQQIIMDILQNFDISDPHSIGPTPIKLVRQCLRQLELLKNVWLNVLQEPVYNKTFCELLNAFCNKLIRRILLLEDISTTVGNELSELIDVVLQKAPTLFREKHEVVHIQCWQKFQQLKLMLNASLKEIAELWCDGAGILTANYKADEVKHLIRALFQNTDRRAKTLSQIV